MAAVARLGVASPSPAATCTGMTQDLLLRSGPLLFRVPGLICVVLAPGLSLLLLARLKCRLEAGSPVGVVGVAVSVAAVGTLWVLAWALGGAPGFALLAFLVWPAD